MRGVAMWHARWLLVPAILAFTLGSTPLRPAGAASASAPFASQFSIASISVEKTNLVLSAEIPHGLVEVILETRPRLDGSWNEVGTLAVPPDARAAVFTIARPAEPAAFFRLKAKRNSEPASLVSSELQYVTTASLGSVVAENGDAIFHFKGLVDGSDRILITREGSLWNHVSWDWPLDAVIVNGTRWKPNEKNFLTTADGTKFLPEAFSLESASLEVISGRDVVALERCSNGLIVHLDDTPVGADSYEFKVRFHAAAKTSTKAKGSTVARLKIAAQIDGSDCFKFTATEVVLEHKNWSPPSRLILNDVIWSPDRERLLKNEGTNSFLPSGIDWSTARIVSRKGRDLATMWAEPQAVWVWFADNPNGEDAYELEIAFGQ